mgnify:FL=1
MGNCCNNKPKEEEDKSNEMKDGIFPKIDNMDEEEEKENNNGKEIKKTLYNFSTNYYQQDSMDSDFVNSEQKKSEEIFNFFNDLRNNPQNYLSEAQKYGVQKIISTAAEKAVEGNIQTIIKNPFYELYFDKCVKASPDSKEEIIKGLEKEEKLKGYEKKLYMITGDSQKPKECVWNLLKISENNGEILWNDIDYLVVTTMFLEDSKNILCYFLFLSKLKKSIKQYI